MELKAVQITQLAILLILQIVNPQWKWKPTIYFFL